MLCRNHLCLVPNIFIACKRDAVPIKLSLPILQLLETTRIVSMSIDLSLQDISYEWHHTLCERLWLASSTHIMLSRFIHVVTCRGTSFLFTAE